MVFSTAVASAGAILPGLLQEVVESARRLVDARYAALGVIGRDGRLDQFLHSGLDPATAQAIGSPPVGRGVLGIVNASSGPVRIRDLADHSASVGFPPGHPPMQAFLGVPIRLCGEVFGNLYFTEPVDRREFSRADESLAVLMATTAGEAIANVRRLAEADLRSRWLAAGADLTYRLLADSNDQPFTLITDAAQLAADADLVTLTVPEDGTIVLRASSGPLAGRVLGASWPAADTLAGQVIRTGEPLMVDEYEPTSIVVGAALGPVMVVPLTASGHPRGALTFARAVERPAFTEPEVVMAAQFANQATLAMELLDARTDQIHLALLEARERLAADLHDHVIQEVFAIGMSLQALLSRMADTAQTAKVSEAIDALDNVINRIRTTIFELQPRNDAPDGLRVAVSALAEQHTAQLGCGPTVELVGPLDSVADPVLVDDVLAVTREALSNCARHAQATVVGVTLTLADELLTLRISDNGRGVGKPTRTSGLTNMRHRAEKHHGTLAIATPTGGGTEITWTAHLLA